MEEEEGAECIKRGRSWNEFHFLFIRPTPGVVTISQYILETRYSPKRLWLTNLRGKQQILRNIFFYISTQSEPADEYLLCGVRPLSLMKCSARR